MEKHAKKKKQLSIKQIEIDTNTDDTTIDEMLAEDADPNYKFPYNNEFVKKNVLRKRADN